MRTLLLAVYRILARPLVLEGQDLRRRAHAMHFPVAPAVVAAAAVLALACSDAAKVTDPGRSEAPAFVIADGARGFKQGFYWLPPMVENPVTSGTFDGALSPVVEICALAGDACDPGRDLIATFTTEGSGSTAIRVGEHHYIVNWHLREYDLAGSTHYRISVFAGPGVLLGYADVEPVLNGGGLKNVDTGEYIGVVDNRTLPIKFRIETGFLAGIGIEPGVPSIALGETQQFTATVTDLHGEILAVPVVWTSSDESVATVDGNGLVTGVGPGSTTITGTVGHLSASASLTVEPVGLSWAQVAAGTGANAHSCGVTTDGRAFCWGSGRNGKLGNGATDGHLSPVAVAGNHQFASISPGFLHSCGVTTDGQAFCWGSGLLGEVGDGGREEHVTPVPVAGNHRFTSVSTGSAPTCGLTTDGEGFCWGAGALGDGGTDKQLTPVAVVGNHQFASLSTGEIHACGVTTDGQAFCWGSGRNGKLGNGGTEFQVTPVAVAGNHQFASISAGATHTCALTTDGQAFCWGFGGWGALGNGGTDTQLTPVPVAGDHQFASISAGFFQTCGVTMDGEAFCWGTDRFGSLGNGGSGTQLTPVAVAGNHQFASISAGGTHTCAVTTSGEAYCWGEGDDGQLGEGLTVNRSVPVRVSDPL